MSEMDSARKVFVTDFVWPSLDAELKVLRPVGASLEWLPNYTEKELCQAVSSAEAILTCWHNIPEAAVQAAQQCKVIGRYGIGLDNIPVGLATRLGILVTNVPTFCQDELSDHVMAFMLAHARRLATLSDRVRSGAWNRDTDPPMRRLRGQTLGLIGFGSSARAVVPKAAAFGLRIVVHTPRLRKDDLPPDVTLARSLQDLLEQSDYVSLHAPSTSETHHLIDSAALRSMKKTSVLINTSRGALVDENALQNALEQGEIGGAALDVLEEEPPAGPISWHSQPNVAITPHSAFLSEESLLELATKGAENVAMVLQGRLPRNLVNPEVLEQDNCRFREAAA